MKPKKLREKISLLWARTELAEAQNRISDARKLTLQAKKCEACQHWDCCDMCEK